MQAFHLLEVFEGFAIVSGVRLMLIVAVVFSFAHITMVFMVLMVLLVCRVMLFSSMILAILLGVLVQWF